MGQRNSTSTSSSTHASFSSSSPEFKQIFDSCDVKKSGVLDVKGSRKFLIKLYKANLFRSSSEPVSLDKYLVTMMEKMDFEKTGTLAWEDVQSFRSFSASLVVSDDDDKNSKSSLERKDSFVEGGEKGGEGGPEFITLWQRFGCPMPLVFTPAMISPLSVSSSFFRTSCNPSSCFRYGFTTPPPGSFSFPPSNTIIMSSDSPCVTPSVSPIALPPRALSLSSRPPCPTSPPPPRPSSCSSSTRLSSSLPSSLSSATSSTSTYSPSSLVTRSSTTVVVSSASAKESIFKLLQYLLRQEPRYGSIPEDACNILKAFENQQIPLTLSTFVGKDGSAFDVMLKWKGEDGLKQRMLKMQDCELIKLVKLTASICERPLLYALNEDVRPGLDPYFPYVLQTEILQYILEKDSARLTLKQEIAQLLYLIVWKTEEPGFTQEQYNRLINLLESSVEAAREIKPDSYSRRPAETDAHTGLQVFTPPSPEDELEMEKSQTKLLSLFCHIQCSLMVELQLDTMTDARAQLPSPKSGDLCPHCGYSKPASRDCRFRKKRRAAPPSSCKFDPNLTCLALSIFGVGTKTLLFGNDYSH